MCAPDLVKTASLLVGLFDCGPEKMILSSLRGKDK